MSEAIQYLGGLEPEAVKRINQAIEKFKFETKFKKENIIQVDELDRRRKTRSFSHDNKPLAHRYRIVIILGDSRLELPRNHGRFYTADEVVASLEDLASVWNFLRDYRTKNAIEQKKRLAQLNRAAAASEEAIKKW